MSTSNEVPTFPGLEDPSLIHISGLQSNAQSVKVDPDMPVWGIGGALLVWVVSILLQAMVPLFFVIPFAMHRGLNPSSPNFGKAAVELAVTDRTAVFLQVLSILPTHILTLALLWAFVTRFGKRPFLASFGWGWPGRLRWWHSVLLGVGLFLVATALANLLGAEKPTQLEQIINSSAGARYAIAALAVLTAPFVEEFIYRGVLYSALQRTIGVNAAVVFVLALFTLIHVPQYWPNVKTILSSATAEITPTFGQYCGT